MSAGSIDPMGRVQAPAPLCHGCKHVSLSITPDAIEKALITFDGERPRLMVYTVRRIHGDVDQTADGLLIDGLCREFTRRAATRDCLIDIHCVLVLRGSSGGSGLRPHTLLADSRLLCSASHKGSNELSYNMERLTCEAVPNGPSFLNDSDNSMAPRSPFLPRCLCPTRDLAAQHCATWLPGWYWNWSTVWQA